MFIEKSDRSGDVAPHLREFAIDDFRERFAQRAFANAVVTRWKDHGSPIMEAGGRCTSAATDGIVLE